MDDGLWALGALAARGVHVLNDPASLLAAHDKLLTARLFRRRSIPHPVHDPHSERTNSARAAGIRSCSSRASGAGAARCIAARTARRLAGALARVRETAWYRRHGALVQELVPPQGYDLRVLVAAGRVVGAVYRVAAAGEWRTNIALGGVRRPVIDPPPEACALAVAAARATGIDARRRGSPSRSGRRLDRHRAERSGRVLARVRPLGRRLRRGRARAHARGGCATGAVGGVRRAGSA